jgi:hypothetical protein
MCLLSLEGGFEMRRYIHPNFATLILCLVFLLIGCTPNPDLSVTNVEVTQAIQTTTNTITLVAQRSTAVRATIGIAGVTGPVSGVTGKLHVFVNGTEITPAAGVAPINTPLTAPTAPQRANENDTLNFELLAPTGISASTDVDFRVDITPVTGETNTGNNSGSASNLTFVDRTTPLLYFTRINYTPSGLGLPSNAFIQPGTGDAFVRGIVPVNDADPVLYRQGLFPSLSYGEDANGDGVLEALGADGNDLLSLLASCRQLIVNSGVGASDRIFLFGWLAGNPINGNGLAQVGGRNAFGNTDPIRGQRSYAHELTHNFGLNHNNRNLDQVGWDVGARLNNNPATNNTTGRVKPITLFDIQTAGLLTNQAWVDTITYNFLLSNATLTAAPDSGGDQGKPVERLAVIQGIFDPTGEKLLTLKPVFRYPWPSQPTTARQSEGGLYLVEITDTDGTVTTMPFTPLVADDPDKGAEHEANGFFEVMVPVAVNQEIASVRILDKDGKREFTAIKRSEPPTITVLTPRDGDKLTKVTELKWEVKDPDTQPDQLLYQVAYSPNGGRDWVPIAVDVKGPKTSITFDWTELQKSDGQGIIRVFVSDGLNTAFGDVTKLSTP